MDARDAAAQFLERLQVEAALFGDRVATERGEWIVKGFIDIFRNVYTISGDTKVVSKLIELMLFPHFISFAERFRYKLVPSREQNHYPDISFVDEEGHRLALDLKSTYRLRADVVNTMTLGAFTGYFRQRSSTKNVTFPYGSYAGHFVLGVIYSRAELPVDEFRIHSIDQLEAIPSVVRDIQFFAQHKYRITKDQPGSGNTKNIGAVNRLADLVAGTGPFAELGEDVFDDYWMYYLTADMARSVDLTQPPYTNLKSYLAYKTGPDGSAEREP